MKHAKKVLLATGKISEQEVDEVLKRFPEESDAVWKAFVTARKVTEIEVFEALAKYTNLEFVDGRTVQLADEFVVSMPSQLCREQRIVPLESRQGYLFVGTDNPNNLEAIDELQAIKNASVVVRVMTPSATTTLINKHFRQDAEISQLSEELQSTALTEDETTQELVSDDADDSAPIVRFVNLLIMQAIRDRASDVHVEPTAHNLRIRYRIDGVLHEKQIASKAIEKGVISRLKVISNIDIAVKAIPQDGRMTVTMAGRKIDIRVTTLPTVHGEKIVMRILDSGTSVNDISSLEMSPRNEEIFRESITRPHGLVLITGPTGSGKSSSLYAVLDEVTDKSMSVVTVENPVERKIDGVSQIDVNVKAGLTFAAALRSILRADPDVVLIGEIRDDETAKIAIDASMTGHLVLSTLHTNGAPDAASRLVEMNVEPYLVGSSVSCVVAQRLARRLCEDCKIEVESDQELLAKVDYPEELRAGPFYKSQGCSSCANTGFRGRIALTEVLAMDEQVEKLILAGEPASTIRRNVEARGFVSLRRDGFEKVSRGITTVAEILRVTRS